MLPNKLQHGDSFARLFDLWNQLIDYLRETRLVAGSGVSISRLPSGTVVNASRQSASSPAAPAGDDYTGFFKIVDVSSDDGFRIMVVDGRTWDPGTRTSGQCEARINGQSVLFDPWDSGPFNGTGYRYVVLQYWHDGSQEHVRIRMVKYKASAAESSSTLKQYEIGSLFLSRGALSARTMSVRQKHTDDMIVISGLGFPPAVDHFVITPVFSEPDANGGCSIRKIRINAGLVWVGLQSLLISTQDFTIPDGISQLVVCVLVHADVSQDFSRVTYSAEFYTSPNSYPTGSRIWYEHLGSVYSGFFVQYSVGDIQVSNVWT